MKSGPLVSVVIPTHNRKDKAVRLVRSVLDSDYPLDDMEIIVVDGASSDGTGRSMAGDFPQVKLIRMEKDLQVSGSRNAGISVSTGKYVFLVDDDNVMDRGCVRSLVETMDSHPEIGSAMPLMFSHGQPERIWCSGVSRNMVTSVTSLRKGEERGEMGRTRLIDTKDCPNAFMLRRTAIEKVGLFDQVDFPFHYEEADYGERLRRAGYRIVCDTKARIWHDSDLVQTARLVQSPARAFYTARNRIVFHRRYSAWWEFMPFILIFYPLISTYYIGVIVLGPEGGLGLKAGRAWAYARGAFSGALSAATGSARRVSQNAPQVSRQA